MEITLSNIKNDEITLQQIFEQGARHMLTQNERCSTNKQCLYRYKNLKCVGGCFISDDEYSINLEHKKFKDAYIAFCNTGVSCLIENVNLKNKIDLICDMQSIHDLTAIENWKEKLTTLGIFNELNVDFLHEWK